MKPITTGLRERIGLRVFHWLVRRGPHTRQAIAEIMAYQKVEEHENARRWAKMAAERAKEMQP